MTTIVLDPNGKKLYTPDKARFCNISSEGLEKTCFQASTVEQVANFYFERSTRQKLRFLDGRSVNEHFEDFQAILKTVDLKRTPLMPSMIFRGGFKVTSIYDRTLENVSDAEKIQAILMALEKSGIKVEVTV